MFDFSNSLSLGVNLLRFVPAVYSGIGGGCVGRGERIEYSNIKECLSTTLPEANSRDIETSSFTTVSANFVTRVYRVKDRFNRDIIADLFHHIAEQIAKLVVSHAHKPTRGALQRVIYREIIRADTFQR